MKVSKAFTLVEMAVVIMVFAILITMVCEGRFRHESGDRSSKIGDGSSQIEDRKSKIGDRASTPSDYIAEPVGSDEGQFGDGSSQLGDGGDRLKAGLPTVPLLPGMGTNLPSVDSFAKASNAVVMRYEVAPAAESLDEFIADQPEGVFKDNLRMMKIAHDGGPAGDLAFSVIIDLGSRAIVRQFNAGTNAAHTVSTNADWEFEFGFRKRL